MNQLKAYYNLTKPGIIRGNLVTLIAGYIFGAHAKFDVSLLMALMVGVALVIASACVFNNVLDRDIDSKMIRTKKRATVTGSISARAALLFATLLGVAGFTTLTLETDSNVVALGVLAFVSYVAIYGFAKRKTVHGTLIGTLPGALPLVAGYVAAAGGFDGVAIVLFLVMVAWQMAHFYAIAVYRIGDYKEAKIPVMPLVYSVGSTRTWIIAYIVLFMVACLLLAIVHTMSVVYGAGVALLGGWWLWVAVKTSEVSSAWAKKVFRVSLVVLLGFSLLISIDSWLI